MTMKVFKYIGKILIPSILAAGVVIPFLYVVWTGNVANTLPPKILATSLIGWLIYGSVIVLIDLNQ